MKAEAILFDKDGTLMDFDAFWVPVSIKAIDAVLMQLQMERSLTEPILEAMGVRDGVTDLNGVLCKGTYGQIGQIVYDFVSRQGSKASRETVTELVTRAYNACMDAGRVLPTCPSLAENLRELKNRGIKLAVVTTDNPLITDQCLKKLGIADLFDCVYTDDGKAPAKPDPWCANDFCTRFGIDPQFAIMVGDTMNDICFARNGGIKAVAVAVRENHRRFLEPYADVVLSELSELLDILE